MAAKRPFNAFTATRSPAVIALTLPPNATRRRRTSLIRRIADLGLGTVDLLAKGKTIPQVT